MAVHQVRAKRSNHKWMIVVCATPLVIVGVAAAVSVFGPAAPTVPVSTPPGYQAISDAYFGYVIPKEWKENDSATTDTGDYYYEGPGGWAGEVLGQRSDPPVLGEAPPSELGVFGAAQAMPFTLTGGRSVTVPGTTVAWSYRMVRNGSVVASVVDAWVAGSSSEVWLAVHADAATTTSVLTSLRA